MEESRWYEGYGSFSRNKAAEQQERRFFAYMALFNRRCDIDPNSPSPPENGIDVCSGDTKQYADMVERGGCTWLSRSTCMRILKFAAATVVMPYRRPSLKQS